MCLVPTACAEKEVEDLVKRLKTRDAQELREVTGKIARLPNALAVPALRQGLHAAKWRTRYMSAKLLGRFQAQEAIPELIDALDDSIGGVTVQAAGALGALWHGIAADCLARQRGQEAVAITELLDQLAFALRNDI